MRDLLGRNPLLANSRARLARLDGPNLARAVDCLFSVHSLHSNRTARLAYLLERDTSEADAPRGSAIPLGRLRKGVARPCPSLTRP